MNYWREAMLVMFKFLSSVTMRRMSLYGLLFYFIFTISHITLDLVLIHYHEFRLKGISSAIFDVPVSATYDNLNALVNKTISTVHGPVFSFSA